MGWFCPSSLDLAMALVCVGVRTQDAAFQGAGHTHTDIHGIMEGFGLKGTLKLILFQPPCQPPCQGQGCLPLEFQQKLLSLGQGEESQN